ncbi:unnamed protein product [Oikopleura dioica]|uniref:Uncharacterized protein n=1 Tax=Oikopleura dioica TaxID=34765 RepID=E4YML8_OIKDI|nr:unnamed protein product [Oikopleura dioica]
MQKMARNSDPSWRRWTQMRRGWKLAWNNKGVVQELSSS